MERRKAQEAAEERETEKTQKEDGIKECMRRIIKKISFVPGERVFKSFLWREYECNVGRKLIRKLMAEMNLVAATPKKDAYKGKAKHDHPCTAPENLVNQNFRVEPRHIICTDITYLYFGILRTTIYLCVFRDAFTKEILGWSVKRQMTTDLIKAAYKMMMTKHGNELRGKNTSVLVHSDQGSQYLSFTFKKLLENDGFLQSVSARGNSQDNAACEAFFSRLKTMVLDPVSLCRSLDQAEKMLDGCINQYNNEIYELDLAGLTPHEFYLYCVTGVYPCEDYFGVKATELDSLESIVQRNLKRQEEQAEKRREQSQERNRAAQLLKKDPVQITIEDQLLLERVIRRYKKHRDKIDDEIKQLEEVLSQAKSAQKFLSAMPEEERRKYGTPQAWQTEPHLNYIYGMAGLF